MRKENAKSSDAIEDTESFGDGSFLRRWSSRKRRARRGEVEETPAVKPAEKTEAVKADESAEPERVLSDEDMPPLESLNEDSDYSGFLSPGVSESLRKLALRKMFLSSKYNVTDGLDDYAEDFTKFAPLGNIITSDMRHQIEMEAERAKQKLEEETRSAMDEPPEGEDARPATASEAPPDGEPAAEQDDALARSDAKAGGSVRETSGDDEFRGG